MSLILFTCAIVNIILAFWVLFKDLRSTLYRVYFFLTISISGWLLSVFVSSLYPQNSAVITQTSRAAFFFVSFMVVALYYFTLVIFEEKVKRSRLLYLHLLPAVFFAWGALQKLIVQTGYSFLPYKAAYGPLFSAINVYFFCYLLMILLALRKKIVLYPAVKRKIYALLVGVIIIFFSAGISALLFPLLGFDSFFWLSYLAPFAFNILLLYTIMHHQALNITIIIRKGVMYSISVGIIMSMPLIAVNILGLKMFESPAALAFFILIITILINILRKNIEGWIERTLYKDIFVLRESILHISEHLVNVLDLEEIKVKIKELAAQYFYPLSQDLFIYNEDNKRYYSTANTAPVAIPEFQSDKTVYFDVKKEFHLPVEHTYDIAIVFKHKEKCLGFLLLELNRKFLNFTVENIDLMKIFANEISIALANALAYEQSKIRQEQLFQSEKVSILGQMTASIVHEIRNPVTSLAMTIENMKNALVEAGYQEKDIERLWNTGQRSVKEIKVFLTTLLNFSRKGSFVKKPADIKEIINDAQYIVRKSAKEKGIAVEIDAEDFTINCDAQKIKQVLLNLFLNSIDAITERGTIIVKARKTADKANLMVQDTGRGIPKDKLTEIFVPFYTSKENGTGLGMSIIKEIIDLHGGTISVESEAGKGTIITINLPL